MLADCCYCSSIINCNNVSYYFGGTIKLLLVSPGLFLFLCSCLACFASFIVPGMFLPSVGSLRCLAPSCLVCHSAPHVLVVVSLYNAQFLFFSGPSFCPLACGGCHCRLRWCQSRAVAPLGPVAARIFLPWTAGKVRLLSLKSWARPSA